MEFLENVAKFIFGILFGVLANFYYGWALSVLWTWFAIPAGLMALPYFAFVGMSFFISAVSTIVVPVRKSEVVGKENEMGLGWIIGITLVKMFVMLIILGGAGIATLILF